MRPPFEDPASVFEPLAPGEKVVFEARPGAVPGLVFLRECSRIAFALLTWVGFLSLFLFARPRPHPELVLGFVFVGSLVLYAAWRLVQVYAIRHSRSYVATNRRAAVVDKQIAYVFRLEPGVLACEEGKLVLGTARPLVVAGKHAGYGPLPGPVFAELDDPHAALEHIREALALPS